MAANSLIVFLAGLVIGLFSLVILGIAAKKANLFFTLPDDAADVTPEIGTAFAIADVITWSLFSGTFGLLSVLMGTLYTRTNTFALKTAAYAMVLVSLGLTWIAFGYGTKAWEQNEDRISTAVEIDDDTQSLIAFLLFSVMAQTVYAVLLALVPSADNADDALASGEGNGSVLCSSIFLFVIMLVRLGVGARLADEDNNTFAPKNDPAYDLESNEATSALYEATILSSVWGLSTAVMGAFHYSRRTLASRQTTMWLGTLSLVASILSVGFAIKQSDLGNKCVAGVQCDAPGSMQVTAASLAYLAVAVGMSFLITVYKSAPAEGTTSENSLAMIALVANTLLYVVRMGLWADVANELFEDKDNDAEHTLAGLENAESYIEIAIGFGVAMALDGALRYIADNQSSRTIAFTAGVATLGAELIAACVAAKDLSLDIKEYCEATAFTPSPCSSRDGKWTAMAALSIVQVPLLIVYVVAYLPHVLGKPAAAST